jgi:hypothetical protein
VSQLGAVVSLTEYEPAGSGPLMFDWPSLNRKPGP